MFVRRYARMSGLPNYKALITPRVRYQRRGMLASKTGSRVRCPSTRLPWPERAFRYTRQKEHLLCGVRLGCYGCYSGSFLSCLINHLPPSLWSGIPASHQSHSSTWPTMHMRLPSAPISSFHELDMMRKLDQSSQKRRELWLGLLSAKGLPTTTTLQLTGFMI